MQEPAPPAAMPPPVAAPFVAPRPQYQPASQAEPVRREAAAAPPASGEFGLPELWRDRRETGNANSAPLVEERALAAMFRMLGNKANGGATRDDTAEAQAKTSSSELFRRL